MEAWQWIAAAVFVILPLALMIDFWGDERLTYRGKPIRREWRQQVTHVASEDGEH